VLHVTNGDHAVEALAEAGVDGSLLPWRDVLHEGPVPQGLSLDELRPVRAGFIADQGWGDLESVLEQFAQRDAALAAYAEHDEVVLWFEHDLYDQLQLVQLLAWFAERDLRSTRLSVVAAAQYLTDLPTAALHAALEQRLPVRREQLDLGREAWRAFTATDPLAIEALRRADTTPLPFLGDALLRLLEELPEVESGLSRTEAQALAAIGDGRSELRDAFVAAHLEAEERHFLGDVVFATVLERLAAGAEPLLRRRDGERLAAPRAAQDAEPFWTSRAVLTAAGRAVLDGRRDWVEMGGVDRWLGGVQLRGRAIPWRWDADGEEIRRV
jgi:hypothetical protein